MKMNREGSTVKRVEWMWVRSKRQKIGRWKLVIYLADEKVILREALWNFQIDTSCTDWWNENIPDPNP